MATKNIIPQDQLEIVRQHLKTLKKDVELEVYTKKGLNDEYNQFVTKLCREFSKLNPKIKVTFRRVGSQYALKKGIDRSPVILFNPKQYSIAFYGAPAGEEGRTFIQTIKMISEGSTLLSEQAQQRLKELSEEREIMVFVSPTCPYCPQQALYAINAAIVNPEFIKVKIIEILENSDLAEQYSVSSVPLTVINGNILPAGLMPEEVFVDHLIAGAPAKIITPSPTKKVIKKDLLIVGAGPAGLTAAIYAKRAGLDPIVIDKGLIGGQVTITPVVENYPGFIKIPGKTLMDMMAQQALQYAEIHQSEEVKEIKPRKDLYIVKTTAATYEVKAIIIATGATHKKLNVPGEERFFGRGVSYCAVCDGFFFRGKKVLMIGGGNTAVTEAIYLNGIGVDVTLVHRRDTLRAEKHLQDSLKAQNIPIIWNTVVEEIMGEEVVTAVRLRNLKENRSYQMDIDGVFIAIGYEPSNELAKMLSLELTEDGYIKVDSRQRTSKPRIYAAGDITGGIKQIVTAVAQGAVAAIAAFEDLASPYWKDKGDMF